MAPQVGNVQVEVTPEDKVRDSLEERYSSTLVQSVKRRECRKCSDRLCRGRVQPPAAVGLGAVSVAFVHLGGDHSVMETPNEELMFLDVQSFSKC